MSICISVYMSICKIRQYVTVLAKLRIRKACKTVFFFLFGTITILWFHFCNAYQSLCKNVDIFVFRFLLIPVL